MAQSKGRILCVDDDEETCILVGLFLAAEGYDVIKTMSISEAESSIDRDGFVLYMIDEWLPDGSGNDLCRKIRAVDLKTPIIIHSGAANKADIDAAMGAGANYYLIKPHGWEELGELVGRLIQH